MIKMKKLVMFDLDGTLVDTIDDIKNAVNYVLLQLNLKERTKDEILSFVGDGIKMLILRALNNREDNLEVALKLFKEYYKDHCLDYSKAYPKIYDLLSMLKSKNVKMAVVSNKENSLTNKICNNLFIEYMDMFIGEQPNFRKKPEFDGLQYVLDYYNVAKEDSIYIGDSEVDYYTCINGNIDSIIVSYGFRNKEFLLKKGINKTCSNVDELIFELKKII